MPNHALLNNVDHHDLRIDTRRDAALGDGVNQVLVLPTEFPEVQRDFPILFKRDTQGAWQAVAILGLDRGENLFLRDGRWQARYVPAVLDRGPFLIGLNPDAAESEGSGNAKILVDLDNPRVSRTKGERVFQAHGGNSPYLDHVIATLRRLHDGVSLAQDMYARFEAAGLLEPVRIEIRLSETEQYTMPDHFTLSEERLRALDGGTLEALSRNGYLGAAYLVAASVGNFSRLIELKNQIRAVP